MQTPSIYSNIAQSTNDGSFAQRTQRVSAMAEAFTNANKGEYLKPTTIAGFIFSRITSNYIQGNQTPVSDLVDVHYSSSDVQGAVSKSTGITTTEYLFSFERVGNYLRTINDVISPLGIELTVIHNADGQYYVNLY